MFQPAGGGRVAVFASDHALEAADAAAWACTREGGDLEALTVTKRH